MALIPFVIESPFVINILSVGATQMAVLGLNFALLRVVIDAFGEQGLGEFVLAKRLVALSYPLLTLGLELAVTRFVSLQPERAPLLGGLALGLVVSSGLAALAIGAVAAEALGPVLLGVPDAPSLLVGSLIFSLGYASIVVSYSVRRGLQRMRSANLLQLAPLLVQLAAVAIVAELSGVDPIPALLLASSIGVGTIVVLYAVMQKVVARWEPVLVRRLLAYGVVRVPSGFLLAATFSGPVLISSSSESLAVTTALGIGVTLVLAGASVVEPVSTMLLPKLTELVRADRGPRLRIALHSVQAFALHAGVVLALFAPGLAPDFVVLWLGHGQEETLPIISLTMVGVGPYVVYVLLRNLLNAISAVPYVTILTAASALTGSVLALVLGGRYPNGVAVAMVGGLTILGAGAFGFAAWSSRIGLERRDWLAVVPIAVAGMALYVLDPSLEGAGPAWSFTGKLVLRGVLLIGLAVLLWLGGISWSRDLGSRMRLRPSGH